VPRILGQIALAAAALGVLTVGPALAAGQPDLSGSWVAEDGATAQPSNGPNGSACPQAAATLNGQPGSPTQNCGPSYNWALENPFYKTQVPTARSPGASN
jgi:hypothetical protein